MINEPGEIMSSAAQSSPADVVLLMPEAQADTVTEALKGTGYGLVRLQTLPELHLMLKGTPRPGVAILDIDSLAVTNNDIKEVVDLHPGISLFCLSSKRVHPHLREALKDMVFACLKIPVQADELRFLLGSVHQEKSL
jgi:hypothetical protein